MRVAGDKSDQMIHCVVDCILDGEDAFRSYLPYGRIVMHNIHSDMSMIICKSF